MKYLKIFLRSFVDFFKDGGIMLAGSISYFTMMALVPFCLFLVTIFGYLLGHYYGFYQSFSSKLTSFFPAITSGITKELEKLIAFKGIGTFSIVLYGILSYQVFSSLENALNVVFKVKKRRNFFWSIILSLIIITLIIVIILFSFIATSFIPLLKALKPTFPQLQIGMITRFLIRYVVPFFIVLFTVTVLYILLPKCKVKTIHAFFGALFTTIFLEIAKHLFTWYVGSVVKYGTIYGSLTAFIIFLLWVFYSSCIFLIGAEIVHHQGQFKKYSSP
jgi:membrane protein